MVDSPGAGVAVTPALLVSSADILGLWDSPDGVLEMGVFGGFGVSGLLAVWATIKFRPQ